MVAHRCRGDYITWPIVAKGLLYPYELQQIKSHDFCLLSCFGTNFESRKCSKTTIHRFNPGRKKKQKHATLGLLRFCCPRKHALTEMSNSSSEIRMLPKSRLFHCTQFFFKYFLNKHVKNIVCLCLVQRISCSRAMADLASLAVLLHSLPLPG